MRSSPQPDIWPLKKKMLRFLCARRHTLYAVLLASFLLAGCARARIVPTELGQPMPGMKGSFSIAPPLRRLPMGESLTYHILWWGIPVGTATLTTAIPLEREDRHLAILNFEAKSNWYLQAFYPVKAHLQSWMDPETFTPVHFRSYLKRHWRLHQSVIRFDRSRGLSVHQLPGARTVEVPVGPAAQDGLSMVYYVRTIPLQLGETIPLEITADGKNWPLKAEVVQAHVINLGDLGRRPAVEGRVELAYPVPFFHGARARVWFSADEQRIPLLAKIRSRIGPVTVVLVERTTDSR